VALIASRYLLSIVTMARCSLMWSMTGMIVAMLGVPQEEKKSCILEDLIKSGIRT